MPRLSSPHSQMKDHYQIIIIGSGYGGSVSASRLARAGQEVCLLERGREIQPGQFPNSEVEMAQESQVNFPDKHVGSRMALSEYYINDEMTILTGCGLGGTSLINGNVAVRTDPRIFEHPRWPQAFRDDVPTLLAEGYERAEAMLGATPYPDHFPLLPKYEALQKAATAIGGECYKPPITVTFQDGANHVGVEQNACILCGDCMTGCNYKAKNTTLMNYLPDAQKHGAVFFTQIDVRTIAREQNRWVINYHLLQTGLEKENEPTKQITADFLILAAGTMGSTQILLRSKETGLELSDQLGHHFSGNGDVGGFAYNCDQPVRAIGTGPKAKEMKPVGPLIVGVIDTRQGAANWAEGELMQEGVFPSATVKPLPSAFKALGASAGLDTDRGLGDRLREKWREWKGILRGSYHGAMQHTLMFLVMTHDDSNGRLILQDDRIRVKWPGVGQQPFAERVDNKLLLGTKALGGTYINNVAWEKLPNQPMLTSHPMGGCAMAEDASEGVVNHKGQLFSGKSGTAVYDNLYVCDASVIPHSIGVNLLLTISAMTERAMVLMAKDHNWQIDNTFT